MIYMNFKNLPRISVIIPLFNQKQYVEEAVKSILEQTYPNIEIIVVNDGSTDNPFPVLEEYKENIILINQENKGLAGARNTGLKNCSGEYIQFLDADDFLHSEKIRLQLEFSKINNAMVSYCEIAQYNERTKQTYLSYIGKIDDMFSNLFNFWEPYPMPIHSLLIKKELFEKHGIFDEELRACEDRYFLSKLAVAGVKFNYFPFIGGLRRIHQYNMNKNRLYIFENAIKYYKKINKDLGDNFFVKKYGFSGYQMMCANLTYMYGVDISRGIGNAVLKSIKDLLKKEGIYFFTEPISLMSGSLKTSRFFLKAFLKRWRKIIFERIKHIK